MSRDNEYGFQRPAQNNVSVRVDSGVERVTIQSSNQRPTAPQEAEYQNPRGVMPSMNVTARDYGSDGNYQSASMYEPPKSSVDGDIIDTAHTSGRSFVPRSALTPQTLVRLPNGMQTTLKNAEGLGYVQFKGGEWLDARHVASSQGPQQAQQQAQQQQQQDQQKQQEADAAAVKFEDPHAEQTFATIMEKAPHVADRLLANFVSKGEISESTVNDLAQAFGLDREHAAEVIQQQYHEHVSMVERVAASVGVQDLDDFFMQFSRSGEALKQATYKLVLQRDPSGFRDAAKIYKNSGGK